MMPSEFDTEFVETLRRRLERTIDNQVVVDEKDRRLLHHVEWMQTSANSLERRVRELERAIVARFMDDNRIASE